MANNYILEYYQKIQDDSIIVGKWIKLIFEYIVKGIENKEFTYNAKKANQAITFIETYCKHSKGIYALKPFKLELWEKAIIACIFGIIDTDGYRQFREVFLVVGRKNGKTLLAAAIAAYCAFLDGEYGGEIYFVAPKLRQANICYNALHQMIKTNKELDALCKKRRTDIYIEESNTTIEPLAFSDKKSDGFNCSCVICDEVASYQGDSGIKFYEVLKSSMGARTQPLVFNITTAGYTNDGIYDELFKRSTRVLMGDSKEKRLLPLIYAIDDIEKWNDINELHKSNPNLGVSVTVDYLLAEIDVAEGSLTKRREFITKYCNIKQNSSSAWLESQVVEKAATKEFTIDDFRHNYCVAGLDLSQTTDLTAAVVVVEKDGELYCISKFWLPEEKIEELEARDNVPYSLYIQQGWLSTSGENFVDYTDCYNWFVELVEKYELLPLKVGFDRYSSQYLIQDLNSFGFHTDDVFQGDNLWGTIQQCEGLLKDNKLHIGQNPLMKMHLLDSAIKINPERGKGKLIKLNQYCHIDGTAALLDALVVREKWFNEIGDRLKNER